MSTAFKPFSIPPGVVSMPTKQMNSSNWSEVNFVRWREQQLTPIGGQARFTNLVDGVEQYVFASRCKRIHGWYDLAGVYHIAYLCEANLYVDTGGVLTDISPPSGLTPINYGAGIYSEGGYSGTTSSGITPPWPAGAFGGYSDDVYSRGNYGTPRDSSTILAIDNIPDAYSLDNFGSVFYAMTLGGRAAFNVGPGNRRRSRGSASQRRARPGAERAMFCRDARTFHRDFRFRQ